MKNQNSINVNNETTYGRHGDISKNFNYGRVSQKDNLGKQFNFTVTNHLEEGKKYKFRYTIYWFYLRILRKRTSVERG